MKLHPALIAACCSLLFALQPVEALTVDTGGTANVGAYASAAIVAGHPAIAYQDETSSDLKFVRAADASGSAWQAPVVVDSAGFVGYSASLAIVNGNPAICYYDGSAQHIRYVRATNAEGTAWGAPVTVYADFGADFSLIVVNGNPAISFASGASQNLFYVRANDVNGSVWGMAVLVDSVGSFNKPSMVMVGDRPAIAYGANGGLWYVRAANATGSTWGVPLNVDGTVFVDYGCSLQTVNGNPAIAYHETTNGDLKFVRSVNATGSAWGARIAIDSAGTAGWYCSLAIVGGNPAISYYVLGPQFDLKYARAADVNGAAWGVPVTVESAGDVGADSSLLEVGGNAAISHHDRTNGDLKFIRSTDASGGTLWPADIAVEQPANTVILDGGSKSYGTVALGSTADLVFTVKNINSGSESLTGLAVTIDGAEAAEFSVTAAPAPSLAGGANTSFTVRHSPGAPGNKTATLHLASSVEGSKNPYDITLTAASVPEITVEQPAGVALADGDGRSFPVAPTGSTADMVFTVENPGGFELTGLGITIDGPDAGEFSVVASPAAPVAPGGSTSFTLRYTAASPGAKTAALHIASNVSGSRNPFDIVLTAVPGTVDTTFNPDLGGVASLAVQPDGKILAGTSGTRLSRFHPDGTRDVGFAPNVNSLVNAIAVQLDRKIVIGGLFTSVGGVTRNRLARLNADGTLDAAFNVNPNSDVSCVALQTDGKILVGGGFTSFVGAGTRNFIARLNADGSLDAGFNPNANGPVRSIAVQADGKIIIGGFFSGVGGLSRGRIARLNSDGTVESTATFNPGGGANDSVNSLAVQADGKILLGGQFTFPRLGIARLNANGTVESTATFNGGSATNGNVTSIALQADGRILLAGNFTSIGGMTRNRIARLNANGTLDTAFNPNANGTVSSVAIQADGRILVGGFFSTIGGTSRAGFTRLGNEPASQFLSASGGNRVDWLRAGASPEIEQVTFELSTDGGNTFSALGTATRLPGGWEKSGLSLPGSGHIRARGRTTGGAGNGSTGLVETVTAFAAEAPEIVVEQPLGTDIAAGGSTSFGDVALGDARSLTFTIKNTGTANLVPLTITKDGADAAMFTITASPLGVMPGGSTTFTVRFAPTGTGAKTAALHIASNDGDENPFDLTLTGLGTLSANADLSGLTLSSGAFTPAFASGTTSYSASVVSSANKVTVTPTVAQSTATIAVNGIAVASGGVSAPVNLSVGSNLVNIVVTAGNGATTKTYTIAITRAVPVPGDIEGEFDPLIFTDTSGLAVQPDGKILVGSSLFQNSPLARLNADGTVESTATFNPGTSVSGTIQTLAVQANGKILVSNGGNSSIVRLNADGTVESAATFTPGLVSGTVFGMALQSDGKIVLGGGFDGVDGQPRNGIARLQANGGVESTATFNPGTGADGVIWSVAVQADGKVLLGSQFLNINGQPRSNLARLNANGTVESTATFNLGTGADEPVYCVAVQPDGKILLGGIFTSINGQPRNQIARLHPDGTLESTTTFNPGTGPNSPVDGIVLQADGKILIGGIFTAVNGQPRNGLARLNADGTLESTATFNIGTGPNGLGRTVALQADGKIVVGGNFFYASGGQRGKVARLINGPAIQNITMPDTTRVQWMRGGTTPEVEQVTFELSLNAGQTWSPLGAGTRIAGGWERTGLSLPASGSIRARGRTVGGVFNASSGLIEQIVAFAPYTPLQQWKLTHLGDANAPDLEDPDADGLRTLAEYGLNLPPETPGGAPLPVDRFTYAEGERLRVFIQRDPAHHDVTVEVQAADSPAGPWSMLAISTLGAPFSGPGYVTGDDPTPTPKTVEVRDTVNVSESAARFIRVQVTH